MADTLFAIIAYDAPDAHDRRMAARADHFAHIERVMDRVAIAGPMKTDAGGFAGSLLIVKAETREEAEALLRSDPYFKADIWDRWDIHPFTAAAGSWIGGKIW
jgi:uncharacterized protein